MLVLWKASIHISQQIINYLSIVKRWPMLISFHLKWNILITYKQYPYILQDVSKNWNYNRKVMKCSIATSSAQRNTENSQISAAAKFHFMGVSNLASIGVCLFGSHLSRNKYLIYIYIYIYIYEYICIYCELSKHYTHPLEKGLITETSRDILD